MKNLTLLLAATAVALAATPPHQKFSPDSLTAIQTNPAANVQVLIQWNIPLGATTAAKIAALGGATVSQMKNMPVGIYALPAMMIPTISADPAVNYISVDRTVQRKLANSAVAINAPSAWASGYVGAGVGVAILDSGFGASTNLGTSKTIVYTQDFTGAAPAAPSYGADWYGHGTHIAGIIASNGKDSLCPTCTESMIGIAPGANLINLKVLNENGEGADSQVIAAIDTAISLKSQYNIRVMNLSLGRPVFESYTLDPVCQAVEAAWKAGIVVVVAAGNDGRDNSFNNNGYGTITAPGNDPYVITVGAMKSEGTPTRTDDLIASYSSKGPTAGDNVVKPDIVAPGNLVVSLLAKNATMPLQFPQNSVPLSVYQKNAPPLAPMPNQPPLPTNPSQQPPAANFGGGRSQTYFTLSGTSMAAAVVSGAVADVLQAYPNLTPDQVKLLLMQTAYKTFPTSSSVYDPTTGNTYTDYYDIFTVGAGYLDMQAALAAAPSVASITGSALSPSSSYDPTTGNVTLQFSNGTTTSTLAGTRTIWGTSLLQGNTANVSGARTMWGTASDYAERTIWGTRTMWGTSSSTATSSDLGEAIEVAGEN